MYKHTDFWKMERGMNTTETSNSTPFSRLFLTGQIVLRILATAFATVSIATLLTSNQELIMHFDTSDILLANARFYYSSALRYKLFVDVAVCAYSMLSLILFYKVVKHNKTDPKTSFYFYLLILDKVIMAMAVSGCAASSAIGLVALQGLNKPGISWAPVCPLVGRFCLKVTLSIAFSYAGFASLAVLSLIDACKLKFLLSSTSQ